MFAAFCSAGESSCTCKSTVFTSLLLVWKNGITWPGMARAVESLEAMARGLVVWQVASPAQARRGRASPSRSIQPSGQEDSHRSLWAGVAWQEAGRPSCTVCQYSPPIGRDSFRASANGSSPDAAPWSSSTEVDCSHTQYTHREGMQLV